MEIVHRISVSSSPEVSSALSRRGVIVSPFGFQVFEIAESDARWPSIKQWIEIRGPADVVTTRFSSIEMDEASALIWGAEWLHGYPQPRQESFGYLGATYDLAVYCADCGIGKRQRAPFQIKGEQKWLRRDMFMLNWVFDEIFINPAVFKEALMPMGIGSCPVMSPRKIELESVIQVDIRDELDICTDGLEYEVCPACGRRKYFPHNRGAFPRLMSPMNCAIAHTRQWFGSGGQAFREIVVAQAVRRALIAVGARGAEYWPLGSAAQTPA